MSSSLKMEEISSSHDHVLFQHCSFLRDGSCLSYDSDLWLILGKESFLQPWLEREGLCSLYLEPNGGSVFPFNFKLFFRLHFCQHGLHKLTDSV